ncbi:hypothetical protein HG530_003989 [Fusarium avenaceum]|nr:hypothetical protein HG530_003989 [Fusarium avenaceum]
MSGKDDMSREEFATVLPESDDRVGDGSIGGLDDGILNLSNLDTEPSKLNLRVALDAAFDIKRSVGTETTAVTCAVHHSPVIAAKVLIRVGMGVWDKLGFRSGIEAQVACSDGGTTDHNLARNTSRLDVSVVVHNVDGVVGRCFSSWEMAGGHKTIKRNLTASNGTDGSPPSRVALHSVHWASCSRLNLNHISNSDGVPDACVMPSSSIIRVISSGSPRISDGAMQRQPPVQRARMVWQMEKSKLRGACCRTLANSPLNDAEYPSLWAASGYSLGLGDCLDVDLALVTLGVLNRNDGNVSTELWDYMRGRVIHEENLWASRGYRSSHAMDRVANHLVNPMRNCLGPLQLAIWALSKLQSCGDILGRPGGGFTQKSIFGDIGEGLLQLHSEKCVAVVVLQDIEGDVIAGAWVVPRVGFCFAAGKGSSFLGTLAVVKEDLEDGGSSSCAVNSKFGEKDVKRDSRMLEAGVDLVSGRFDRGAELGLCGWPVKADSQQVEEHAHRRSKVHCRAVGIGHSNKNLVGVGKQPEEEGLEYSHVEVEVGALSRVGTVLRGLRKRLERLTKVCLFKVVPDQLDADAVVSNMMAAKKEPVRLVRQRQHLESEGHPVAEVPLVRAELLKDVMNLSLTGNIAMLQVDLRVGQDALHWHGVVVP